MLKIQRSVNNKDVILKLSGRLDESNLGELQSLLGTETKDRPIILDLKDLTLVDRETVKFLERCEADSIKLANCPAYIREWITRERGGN